jgi:pyruvyl transferase EpsO
MTSPKNTDAAFEQASALYHDKIGPLLPPDAPFALLDFPDHSNVGDSAIWAGELAFLDRHNGGRRAAYVGTLRHDPAEVTGYVPEGPVLLHGGGNFGDTWSAHQEFRYRALEVLKGRPVVQLPQSIHFEDPAQWDVAARHIDAHGQFTLCVRDQESHDAATKHFDCPVVMVPDAAVNIFKLPSDPPSQAVLSVLRTDREAVWTGATDLLKTYGDLIDWPAPNVWTLPDRIQKKLLERTSLTRKAMMAHREAMYRRHAQMRVDAGVKALSQGRFIVSDRLHVHLISALMRRPHAVLDNFYGKISRHIALWGDFHLAQKIPDMDALKETLDAQTT